MSLFDSFPTLPKVSDSSVNYSVPSDGTKINESFASMQNRLGGVGPFKAMSVGAPSFSLLSAGAALGKTVDSLYTTVAAGLKLKSMLGGATAKQVNENTGTPTADSTAHMVKLVSYLTGETVAFNTMPNVSEQRTVDYEPLNVLQMPGEFQKYVKTKSTTWTINPTFTCTTSAEATERYKQLCLLRAWTMPYFGNSDQTKLGAPPDILALTGWRGLVGEVPVVITSLSWTWPREVDWIPTLPNSKGEKIPFPTVMEVNVNVVECYSPSQFSQFSLSEFKNGNMVEAFGTIKTVKQSLPEVNTVTKSKAALTATGATGLAGAQKAVGSVSEKVSSKLSDVNQSAINIATKVPSTLA